MSNRILSAGVWVLLIIAPLRCQTKDDHIFKRIPADSRPQLIARLNLLLAYDRTRQFGKLFELLSSEWLSQSGTPSDKSGYIAFREASAAKTSGWNLLSFKPVSVSVAISNEPGVYTIRGRAKLQSRASNRTSEEDYFIEAQWKNSEWYFSEPYTSIFSVMTRPRNCQARAAGAIWVASS